ncbi:nkp1p [Saccharomyces arboricola H-6]|uniref:Nkp1p n=1 Tax=Saccharomyces arboricola (strain H-6 / AS 2.3317 / CBS 10644) TaxID=1160507 RepID=J8PJF8_SACAR|nr:nkp1p [Saccharomyces arboricola H-6]
MAGTYDSISKFIEDELSAFLSSDDYLMDDFSGEIPNEVSRLLKAQVIEKRRDTLSRGKQDLLSKEIYDNESELRIRQSQQIMDLIGDIPKYSLGSELRNRFEGEPQSTSIKRLIEDVLKLPQMEVANEEEEEEPETANDLKILNEYCNLRRDLILKCQAIQIGESKISEIMSQVSSVESLITSIKETSEDDDVSKYFATYNGKLVAALEEMKLLLEEAIKTSDSSPGKRQKIKDILSDLKK